MSVFDQVRDIPAWQAAEHQGLQLKRSGSRWWACCPLHGEKTSSLCFYPDGGWYCFGCHKGGDAVSLYQELLDTDALTAAQRLAEDFGISIQENQQPRAPSRPKATAYHLMQELERRRGKEWSYLCDGLHRAETILDKYTVPSDAAWDNPEFINALKARTYANQRLDYLAQASYQELAQEYREREALNAPG